jgi:hypothetical protein
MRRTPACGRSSMVTPRTSKNWAQREDLLAPHVVENILASRMRNLMLWHRKSLKTFKPHE